MLDYEEGWALKNWCFWTAVQEKTLESPLDCKDIKAVHPKGNQPWIFIGRTDAEGEAPILWPPDAKSQLTGKSLMLGEIEGRRRRGRQRMIWLEGIIDLMARSLCKLMFIELVILSNHLILCCLLLLPFIFPSIRVFSNESALGIRWPKYWSFSFSISPSNE